MATNPAIETRHRTDKSQSKDFKLQYRKHPTEPIKANLKAARANRIITDETKEKLSKSLIEYWKKVIWTAEINEDKNNNENE
jgi:hypothetical protein